MNVGVPREIMNNEYRVGMIPSGVRELVRAGHRVIVEKGAGAGSGIADSLFADAGAVIADDAAGVFGEAELIVKVKEPQAEEFGLFRESQALFTFLHLAPKPELTDFLCRKKICAIAYETVQLDNGLLPVLAPMSEVAGRLSIQAGAHYLEKSHGGSGILLGGVPGVKPGRITVLGGGIVGSNAVRIAQAIGAEVTVLDINMRRLEYLDELYAGRVRTLLSTEHDIGRELAGTDLAIGAVLIPGRTAPRLVSRKMVAAMRPGSVIVDVAIDQGGCFATAKATSHSSPVYEVDGVIHYCVVNMPGAVPVTSTSALTNVTLPYILEIAGRGPEKALRENSALRRGLNVYQGCIVNKEVAVSQQKEWREPF